MESALETARSLARIEPFGRLAPDLLAELARRAGWVRLGRWETAFSEGTVSDAAWALASGGVLLVRDGVGNNPVCVRDASPGKAFCFPPPLGPSTQPFTALAPEPASLLRVPLTPQAASALAVDAARLASGWEKEAADRLVWCREPSVRRVARELWRLSNGGRRSLRVTRRELALESGATVVTVFRALRTLKRRRLIRGGAVLSVADPAGLSRCSRAEPPSPEPGRRAA